MANNLHITFSNAISWLKMLEILLKFNWNWWYVNIDWVLPCRHIGEKPLHELIMTHFADTGIHHLVSTYSAMCACYLRNTEPPNLTTVSETSNGIHDVMDGRVFICYDQIDQIITVVWNMIISVWLITTNRRKRGIEEIGFVTHIRDVNILSDLKLITIKMTQFTKAYLWR